MRICDWSSDVCSSDLTAMYLAQQLDEFGRVDFALAAYNAGPGRVRSVRRIPRIAETQNYVRQIMANWRSIEAGGAIPNQPSIVRAAGILSFLSAPQLVQSHSMSDRKSTRRTPVTNAHLVCRLLLEKKKKS